MSISGFVHNGNLLACIHFFAIAVSGSLTQRMTIISMNSYALLSYHRDVASFVTFAVLALDEKHCFLNPVAAVASSVLCSRHCSIGECGDILIHSRRQRKLCPSLCMSCGS
jgi:hypothetical protein